MRPPRTTDDWKNIAKDFYEIWNLPHCIGAIDGKHVNKGANQYQISLL